MPLVEFTGGLENWLSQQQKYLQKWRIKFINHMKRFHIDIGEQIKRLQKSYARNNWYDTGTLHKRIDYIVTYWNSIVFGIIEPNSDYYDSAKHSPTDVFMTKYRGWKPSPLSKHYAGYINAQDSFMERIVNVTYTQQTTKEVRDFMKDNPVI